MTAPAETSDNPAAAGPSTDGRPLHIWNDSFKFLPSPDQSDLTLVCIDNSFGGQETNPEGGLNAFKVKRAELIQASGFFSDVLSLATKEANHTLSVKQKGHIVAYVLSATLEPPHAYLATVESWDSLAQALDLAIKWECNGGRIAIFHAMLARFCAFGKAQQPSPYAKATLDLVGFIIEAIRQGQSALAVVTSVLRDAAAKNGSISIPPVAFSERHFLDVGAAGCSQASDLILQLGVERVLKR